MGDGMRRFYMCDPDHFRVDYAINAWTCARSIVDPARAREQWGSLLTAYVEAGVEVRVLAAEPQVPALTFAGDSIFLFGKRAISSRFRHGERLPEVRPMARRFEALGYHVSELPERMHFEGNAEAMYWNGMLLFGLGVKRDRGALAYLGNMLDVDVASFELVAPYHRLDVCLTPIDGTTALYYPHAFTAASLVALKRLVPRLVPVSELEARVFSCNSVSANDTVVMGTRRAPRVARLLRGMHKRVVELELSEFAKAGGGPRCLMLEAYRSSEVRRAVA